MESTAPSESPKAIKKQQPLSERECPLAEGYTNSIIRYLSFFKIQIEHGNKTNMNDTSGIWESFLNI